LVKKMHYRLLKSEGLGTRNGGLTAKEGITTERLRVPQEIVRRRSSEKDLSLTRI